MIDGMMVEEQDVDIVQNLLQDMVSIWNLNLIAVRIVAAVKLPVACRI